MIPPALGFAMDMIFRWSIWGEDKEKRTELLTYSIRSFRHHFGNGHNYVVAADDVESMRHLISSLADMIEFHEYGPSVFDVDSKATWRKWCPRARLDVQKDEVYIDSDVFLLKHPVEIDALIADPKFKFAVMDEFLGQPWQHGAMNRKAPLDKLFINAGVFIQKAGWDITPDLVREFEWWKNNIRKEEQTHHDEQGALAIALKPYWEKGELLILPKDKYVLIGPNENNHISSFSDVTMFHAVYPEHPAFYRFRKHLDRMLGDQAPIVPAAGKNP